MTSIRTCAAAAASALILSFSAASACDYAMPDKVTAEAKPAPTTTAAPSAPAAPSAATMPETQTAAAPAEAPGQPKAN